MLEKRTVIAPPEYTLSPEGKLHPVAHVVICDVVIDTDTGEQIGKSKPHRAALVMQPDGSWEFEPPPRHPTTGLLFSFSAGERAAWNATLDVLEERYGVIDHAFPDETVVTYTKGNDGKFVRQVTKP